MLDARSRGVWGRLDLGATVMLFHPRLAAAEVPVQGDEAGAETVENGA
ncbi:MAG: hypothetical protein ACRELU_02830 [Gemmatimonadota bacterium]